jgi:DNA-binding NarL/FixJ family response regulator
VNAAGASTAERPRVLIAADQIATSTGVRLALGDSAECTEVEDVAAAVVAALRDRPDVCVFVFDVPAKGIRATAEITSKAPDTVVLVMTRRIDENECLAAVRAGAKGYVSQGIDPARLPFLIRSLMRGEAAIPRLLVRILIDEMRGRKRLRQLELHERSSVALTEREWEVVEALRKGLSTREIAMLLGISDVTVRRHASAVHQKLGTHSRHELLALLGRAADPRTR